MTVKYRRVPVKQPRYMILHSMPVNCLAFGAEEHCMTRFEWRSLENLDETVTAVVNNFAFSGASGPYTPIKF